LIQIYKFSYLYTIINNLLKKKIGWPILAGHPFIYAGWTQMRPRKQRRSQKFLWSGANGQNIFLVGANKLSFYFLSYIFIYLFIYIYIFLNFFEGP
jgi:hypothetical protein